MRITNNEKILQEVEDMLRSEEMCKVLDGQPPQMIFNLSAYMITAIIGTCEDQDELMAYTKSLAENIRQAVTYSQQKIDQKTLEDKFVMPTSEVLQ